MHVESLKCHCFTSYFMSKLVDEDNGYNFENVKRWFKDVNIFNYKVVVFPTNFDRLHWVAICVHFDEKCIQMLRGSFISTLMHTTVNHCYVKSESNRGLA